jgi:hypothetical protein
MASCSSCRNHNEQTTTGTRLTSTLTLPLDAAHSAL